MEQSDIKEPQRMIEEIGSSKNKVISTTVKGIHAVESLTGENAQCKRTYYEFKNSSNLINGEELGLLKQAT